MEDNFYDMKENEAVKVRDIHIEVADLSVFMKHVIMSY